MRTIFGCLALAVAGLGLSLSDSARLLDTSEEANAVGAGVFSVKRCVFISHNGCYNGSHSPGGPCDSTQVGDIGTNCDLRDIHTCQTMFGWSSNCTSTVSANCPNGKSYQCKALQEGGFAWILLNENAPCGNYDVCEVTP
jgi:hypothetical protein